MSADVDDRSPLGRCAGPAKAPFVTARTNLFVAAVIALAGFGIGQIAPHAGMPLVILASLAWTCRSVQRARRRAG